LKGSMRENGFRAIGGLTQRLTSSLSPKGKKGAGAAGAPLARLKAEWAAIVGTEIAGVSRPDALLAGRGGRSQGGGKVLRLRVVGAASLEIQHRAAQLVERVNGYFGHRFIDDIRLVQGGIPAPPPPRTAPVPDPQTAARLAERVATVKDPELKAALARLGARIVAGRRSVLLGAVGAMLFGRAPRAQWTDEQDKLLTIRPGDHVLGHADAPNVIIDYFSLTCPHCANFAAAVLPGVRKEFVETGQARFVYRHFPSDSVATHASQLTECAGPGKFFETIDALFHTQVDWLTASDPEAEMVKILAERGLVAGDCLANDQLLDKIVDDVQTGQTLGVRQTPTLFINGQNCGNPGSTEAIGKILREMGR
jgi:protein-disulfide isomerase